jgi:hypothetical protein
LVEPLDRDRVDSRLPPLQLLDVRLDDIPRGQLAGADGPSEVGRGTLCEDGGQ